MGSIEVSKKFEEVSKADSCVPACVDQTVSSSCSRKVHVLLPTLLWAWLGVDPFGSSYTTLCRETRYPLVGAD